MKLIQKLSGKKTYIMLWTPVVLALVALIGVELDPAILKILANNGIVASKPAGWVAFVALAVRALDQTFMRLGIRKAEKAGLEKPRQVTAHIFTDDAEKSAEAAKKLR